MTRPPRVAAFAKNCSPFIRFAGHLAEHGGAEVSGGEDDTAPAARSEKAAAALRSIGLEPWALFPAPGIQVRLTDLGRYAIREQLLAARLAVPLAEPAMTP